MKQTPNNSNNKESSKSSIISNTNKIQQQRKHHNPLKIKQDFKKHASVVQSTNSTNTNVSTTEKYINANAENESQTLLNKLKTLNPKQRPQSCGKSPRRSTSKARQEPSPRDKEITNLKNEIQFLKQSQTNSITRDNQKNVQTASTLGGQATNNTE